MKKRVLTGLCLVLVVLLIVSGCGFPSPEVALMKYWQATAEGDITATYAMRCRDDRKNISIDRFKEVTEEIVVEDFSHLEIKKSVITGNDASVEFYNSDQGETHYQEMVFEDGEWKMKL